MPDTASVIEKKVKDFAKDITKFLNDKRTAKIAELKKKSGGKDPGESLVTVTFKYSSGKGSLSRTPEQQAAYVAKGTSWTCSGSHMVDKARHVLMMYGGPGKKAKASWALKSAFGSKPEHFCTMNDLKTKWKALMSTHGLKNHKGGDGMGAGDEFHFELADSKVPRTDKRVQACLVEYARLTRVEGGPPNTKFENSSWKSVLKPHLDKAEKEAAKKKDAAKREELKKMQFDGAITGKTKLMTSANRSGAAPVKTLGDIDVPSPIDSGKAKTQPGSVQGSATWDSLGRSVFEYLGLLETKGFDVKVICGLSFDVVSYENLSQKFLRNVKVAAEVIYNTPAAKMMGTTITSDANLKLTKSAKEVVGTIVFDVVLKSPIDTETAKIILTIKGAKGIAKVKK